MSVLEQVRADVISAMKAGERDLATALRLLVSELQKDAKEGKGDELAVLRREHKRRLEAAGQFEGAARPELARQERAEAEMISRYLPPELSDERLQEIVAAAIERTGAGGPGDMGAVMKVVMDQAAGLVDGKRASAAVRAALAREHV
ncbi:MAG: GatB/YqeY domain-containing protein [Acidobacteriota bacterium]|nr:GatB/YqeY domain-containing protein [Acidobacteriota bacterium]